jgi:hypothetical protein
MTSRRIGVSTLLIAATIMVALVALRDSRIVIPRAPSGTSLVSELSLTLNQQDWPAEPPRHLRPGESVPVQLRLAFLPDAAQKLGSESHPVQLPGSISARLVRSESGTDRFVKWLHFASGHGTVDEYQTAGDFKFTEPPGEYEVVIDVKPLQIPPQDPPLRFELLRRRVVIEGAADAHS